MDDVRELPAVAESGRQTGRCSKASRSDRKRHSVSILLPLYVLLIAIWLRSARRLATDPYGLARFHFLFQVQSVVEIWICLAAALTKVYDEMALNGGLLGERTITDLTAKWFLAWKSKRMVRK